MKPKKEITFCEYCDEVIYLESPPKECYYSNGRIRIKEGSVLLPDYVVEHNKDNSHSKDISGYYCNIVCLTGHIKNILHMVSV